MSAIRDEALELCLAAFLATSDCRLVYVDDTYTYDEAHTRLDDVDAGARLWTITLTGEDDTDGALTADDPADQTPAAGKTILGAWLYRHTGVESTSELLVWYDRKGDGSTIAADSELNPTTGDPISLTLPVAPYGLLKL